MIPNEKGVINPIKYADYVRDIDLPTVINKPLTIRSLAKANKTGTIKVLVAILRIEIEKLNFTKTIQGPQIHEAAMLVFDKFGAETFDDILLAFWKFKLGELSINVRDLFKLSPADIVQIIQAYNLEIKIPERERLRRSEIVNAPREGTPMSFKELNEKARKYREDKVREKVRQRKENEQEVKNHPEHVFMAMRNRFYHAYRKMKRAEMVIQLANQPKELKPYVLALMNEILEKRGEQSITASKG